jgi:hypothetical protein
MFPECKPEFLSQNHLQVGTVIDAVPSALIVSNTGDIMISQHLLSLDPRSHSKHIFGVYSLAVA